jgi:hypothetical protein
VAGAVYFRRSRTSQPAAQAERTPDQGASKPSSRGAGESAQAPAQQGNNGDEGATWSCQCGQEFRVSGRDRHRLYWLPDAKPEDPVLDDQCPNCERQLSEQAS